MAGNETGIAAGRNTIVANTMTDFVMILDDDVLFHSGTRLELLLAHLQQQDLDLVAACYHPDDCYTHDLVSDGRGIKYKAVSLRSGMVAPLKATVVHNAFIARTSVLRSTGWDARQHLMEHETFFASLAVNEYVVGFDPNVTVLHQQRKRSPEYLAKRHAEELYLQFMCRNFPRVQSWSLPFFYLDCLTRRFALHRVPMDTAPDDSHPTRGTMQLMEWNANDDRSTVVYKPARVTCFIGILSESGRVRERDALRSSWIRSFWAGSNATWDYGFFVGGGRSSPHSSQGIMMGDIVHLAVPDDYGHLGDKVLALLQWALHHVDAQYICKVDDDTWLRADEMASWLHSNAAAAWYGGTLYQANVERIGRW